MTTHLALVGPTASGKSQLALAAAAELGDIEILSVDSMQVYRGMDIGTAKPGPAERAQVPHHLLDVADPGEDYSVARFAAAATEAISAIEGRGHRALLVGGTGLYFQVVADGLELPGEYPEVRNDLDERAREPAGLEGLYRRLERLDPVAAARIEPANQRRVVRALEVVVATGRPFSSYGPGVFGAPGPGALSVRTVGMWMPRAALARRIVDRFAAMADAGLVDEVTRLANAPAGMSRTARAAIGYKEVVDHLEGRLATLAEAMARSVDRTRALSRRQRMWFRRDPRTTWIGVADKPLAALGAVLATWNT